MDIVIKCSYIGSIIYNPAHVVELIGFMDRL